MVDDRPVLQKCECFVCKRLSAAMSGTDRMCIHNIQNACYGARFEIIDEVETRPEDTFGNGPNFDQHRLQSAEIKSQTLNVGCNDKGQQMTHSHHRGFYLSDEFAWAGEGDV